LLARQKEAGQRDKEVAMVFRIASEWLALPGACCLEVVSQRPIRRLPHRSNRALAGLISVRGELLLCLSLEEPLGLARAADTPGPTSSSAPRLLVVGTSRCKLAFSADEVLGLQRYSPEMLGSLPATNAHAVPRLTRGILTLNQRKIGLLDEERLFSALEKALA